MRALRSAIIALSALCVDSAAAQSPAARAGYATQIERAFLSKGTDISVMAPERPSETMRDIDAFKQYPRLVLFGYLSKPFVYQSVAQTALLENARQLGFKGVEFMDRGRDGRWFFNISGQGPLPRCDQMKRLCF